MAEYAPKDKKNLYIAISNGGIPLGSMLSAVLAILLMEHIGWRGMFWIGAAPIVTLLPLAYFKMPESVAWLAARGRVDEAQALSLIEAGAAKEVGKKSKAEAKAEADAAAQAEADAAAATAAEDAPTDAAAAAEASGSEKSLETLLVAGQGVNETMIAWGDILLLRGGKTLELTLTIGQRPAAERR